ncbi:calpastatin isoform X4 [Astyanax mexicanus]|uniref:calpastatin isoform X4 n=1 Tax=Astyanax mexicanus TaxID=7994 RepID=UPI0020CB56AA|nr:calpastatin isoform X4 [Astyanax mexicanus]
MPSKKRTHGRKRKPKQQAEAPGGDKPGQISNVSTSKSQAKQTTPTPAAPVSTVKPAEYEKGAASASSTAGSAAKPAAATTAASTAASTAAAVSAGASAGAKVSGGGSAGAAGGLSSQSGSSKVSPKTPSITPDKAPSVSTGSGAAGGLTGKPTTTDPVKPKDTSKDKPQSTSIPSPKPEPSKVTTIGAGSAAKKDDAKPKEAKVQVEVPPPAAKASAPAAAAAVDPFDALAGSLPSSEPLAPKPPKYTGPEVKESGLTSEEAKRCGEKEHTLPPGYRKEDMEKKSPAGVPEKPKEVAKPLTDDEMLESLTAGFVSSAAPSAPKSQATPPTSSAKAAPPVSAGGGAAGGAAGKGAAGAGSVIGKPASDAVKPKDTVKDTVQSTTIPSSKSEPPKAAPSGAAKPSAPANVPAATAQKDDAKSKEAKVQAAVSPPAAKASAPAAAAAGDPFDALAGSLPSSEPLAPKPPKYTGPEVKEPGLTSKEAKRCGEHDFTLPPGYRKEDMEKKAPAGKPEKPKDVPKHLTDDDALDSLSAGFGSTVPSAPEAEVKVETAAVAKSSQAPPPPSQKRQEVPAPTSVSPAPPADKKAKVEKPVKDSAKAAPPTSQPSKPKAVEDDPMSLDALSALSDSLPSAKPVLESPKLRPEDIVKEKEAKSEKGVRVGEREDSLPPEYRFPKEKLSDKPAPPKEPSMDSGEALDILSGDFSSPSVAPAVKSSAPPSAPAKKQPKVEDLSALDALAGDFVAPAQAKKVASSVPPAPPPAAKSTPAPTADKGESMSLDALSALEDLLPAAKPVPESPKLRPEDIIDEKELTSEKGVRVGEREDTLPPEYRFPKEDPKKHPTPPQREPSLDSAGALDILSGDFTSSSAAPAVKAPVPPSAPPADSSADFALDELAADFVAPTSASKVQSAVTGPPKADRQLSEGTTSAMDALSDTLMDVTPVPEPKPISPKDIVKEKTVVEEKVKKAGERDDSLPPEFRPTEADIKAAAKAKAELPPKQVSMDETAALDLLSGDFTSSSAAAPVAPPSLHSSHSTPAKTQSAAQASGPVLDKLADTLLPNLPGNDTKPKDSKPKKPAVDDVPAVGELPGKPSTDVVSSSSTKKGGRS